MLPFLNAPVNPDDPSWKNALSRLQGGILKSHGRNHMALVLLQLQPGASLRQSLGSFAGSVVTSAQKQIEQAREYNERKHDQRYNSQLETQLFGSLFLSVWGYLALGYSPAELCQAFPNPQGDWAYRNWFLEGMEHHGGTMSDPPRFQWEAAYRDRRLDALLLLACNDEAALQRAVDEAVQRTKPFATVIQVEQGHTWRRGKRPIELFGFADGISQPEFFSAEHPDHCNPEIVLVDDGLTNGEAGWGSYLVYRKMEQNVKGFHEAEQELAKNLRLCGDRAERAGAMLIGRFRDGTPLDTSETPVTKAEEQPDNSFSYADDAAGRRCPLHAHIRKVRPRNQERDRLVRRGVSYGEYDPTSRDPYPETGNGLLFLSFQRNIREQFGMVMRDWCNRADFPQEGTGQDPLTGQGASARKQSWPWAWSESACAESQFGRNDNDRLRRFVTLLGGEFFFAPSLPFFDHIAAG